MSIPEIVLLSACVLVMVWVNVVSIMGAVQAGRALKAFKAKPYLHDYCRVCGRGLTGRDERIAGLCPVCEVGEIDWNTLRARPEVFDRWMRQWRDYAPHRDDAAYTVHVRKIAINNADDGRQR